MFRFSQRNFRVGRTRFLVVACLMQVAVSNPAHAVTVQECRSEVEQLHDAIPAGIDSAWKGIIEGYVDTVNAITDEGSWQVSIEKVWAESDAYDVNPDPDGDGYALSNEVFSAASRLQNCLHLKRRAELSDPENVVDAYAPDQGSVADEVIAEDLSSPPVKVRGSAPWFTENDYPIRAMREQRQGVVTYDVTVGADGKVLGCQASGPVGSADLEEATCAAIMARARFEPAKDAAGNPVVGEYSGKTTWAL